MRPAAFRSLLAGLLALVQSLAPLAPVHAGPGTPGWTEVCSRGGVRFVSSGDAPASPSDPENHCPLCRAADAPPCGGAAPPGQLLHRAIHEAPLASTGDPARGTPRHDAPARAPPATC